MSGIDIEFQELIFDWFMKKVDFIKDKIEAPQEASENEDQVVTFTEYIHPKQLTIPS